LQSSRARSNYFENKGKIISTLHGTTQTLFGSLEGRGKEDFGELEIKGKMVKSFTFFERETF